MTTPEQNASLQALLGYLNLTPTKPAEPPQLPPINEDPAILAGQEIQRVYSGEMQAARQDHTRTEIQRAEAVLRVWKTNNDRLAELYQDLQTRRTARADWIEQQLPIGPGIPTDTTRADKAVLQAAFNTALTAARAANDNQLADMLADAERFDDDTKRRAVFTAAIDQSRWNIINAWTQTHAPDTGALLTEWKGLKSDIAGRSISSSGWVWQSFRQIPRPSEIDTYPRLVEMHNRGVQAHNSLFQVRNGQAPKRTDIINIDTSLLG